MSHLLVLHALRIKGVAAPESVAVATGLGVERVVEDLRELGAAGLVRSREGVVAGWALTADGRLRERELVALELEATGGRPSIEAQYRDFLFLNAAFRQTCTDWQLRGEGADRVLNDHADADYDRAVLSALASIGDELRKVLAELIATLPRFRPYQERLRVALAHVAAGELEYVTGPLIDSVHTVWFELHEDLLTTLNVQRSSEVET